jgi:colanic acid/amylovoran biosynthesis glycosyltransferase
MTACLHLFNVLGLLTEQSQAALVRGLSQRGCRITVACETLAPQSSPVAWPLHVLPRIEVAPTDDVDVQMDALAQSPEHPARRNASLWNARFDIIHGHFGPRVLHAGPWIARGTPTLISLYGYDTSRLLRDPAWIKRYRWAARHGTIFVALSQDMANRLLAMGLPPNSLRLIRLGIDLAAHPFEPTPTPKPARFVFIGRFTEKKAPMDLLEAMAGFVRQKAHRDARLEMIGPGDPATEQQLRPFVTRHGLQANVFFRGTVPFEQLPQVLRGATALVLPSAVAPDGDREGAPMVLMHAQALGVPCITTRHAGNPEVLPGAENPQGQSPFVVPEHDPPAIAGAMKNMAAMSGQERLSLQHAGRQWIETHYNLANTINQYHALTRELASP